MSETVRNKLQLGLIISNDWELFGDGSGDYFDIQHRPLQSLLNVVREQGAKLTVMAEIGQQFAHQRIAERESWAREITQAWEDILQQTVKAGHDVQLHLHPTWLDAEYKDDKWNLNFQKWSISSLKPEEMEKIFRRSKTYLDGLLKPVHSGYDCISFRAGAYSIQPSVVVTKNLLRVGFLCDTSIIPGMYNPPFLDFRNVYSNVLPWFVNSDDIRCKGQGQNGLLEIPLCSYRGIDIPLLRKYVSRSLSELLCFGATMTKDDQKWMMQRRGITEGRYPVTNRPFVANRLRNGSIGEKLRWTLVRALGSRRVFTLDYDQLPSAIFIKCVQKIYDSQTLRPLRNKDVIVPLMVIGHVKTMHNCENIRRILDGISKVLNGGIVHWTLTDAVKYWLESCRSDPAVT
jgi:hypothetical protein